MDRPWPRGPAAPCFPFGASIWATLPSLFSIRRRSEESASRERERGQNTPSAGDERRSAETLETKWLSFTQRRKARGALFFLARLFAIISSALSSLRRGIWLHGTLFKHKSCSHAAPRVPVRSLLFWGGGVCMQKPGPLRRRRRRRRQGRRFVASAQAVDFTRRVIPRYTRDTQTPGWGKTSASRRLESRAWNYVSVYLISLRVPPGRHCRATVMNKHY